MLNEQVYNSKTYFGALYLRLPCDFIPFCLRHLINRVSGAH